MWQPDNDFPIGEVKTWYCQSCSNPIRREQIKAEERCKCGGAVFALRPKKHYTPALWNLTEKDVIFLKCQRISPK